VSRKPIVVPFHLKCENQLLRSVVKLMDKTKQFILVQTKTLNVWRRGDERAPHKPLLMLLALARITQGQDRLIPFSEIEQTLGRLLIDFGPPRKSVHPEYPFWRLQHDELWEVPDSDSLVRRRGNSDPLKSEVKEKDIHGGFPKHVYDAFLADRKLLERVARALLDAHFPTSLHDDILNEIRLSLTATVDRQRDSKFRLEVIRAYEHRCAICNYDLKIGTSNLALEAAHIKWHQAGGPDEVTNGLALCAIHHKALDRGAIGLTDDLTVLISSELHGQNWIAEWFESFKGKRVRRPIRSEWYPKPEFIRWHSEQVFRKPARD
jgi:putative restriction endonuclease